MILSETRGRVRVLTLNRPEKRNALNGALCAAILQGLRAADADPDIAAVVILAAGPGFSAGADLGERQELGEDQAAHAARLRLSLDLLAAPGLLGKPVVSGLHGHAVGAGVTLALCGDLVIAAEDVQISYPEAKRGIYPSLVIPALLRHVGPKTAFELLATGRAVAAEEALRLGLVNRVVPRAELAAACCAAAEGAALFGAAEMRRLKAAVNAQGGMPGHDPTGTAVPREDQAI